MKKIILFISLLFIVVGCNKSGDDDLIGSLNDKINSSNNYQMTGTLEIFRNEDKFTYDVISTYKKEKYFKVELVNQTNSHKQIILRDLDSVYVLTPSLNKSFKFQSEWPYNNSQIYLLQPIITDVESDKNFKFEKLDDGYVVSSNVNYASEKDFKTQKIYFDLNKDLKKVEVLDKKENIKMVLNVISLEYDVKLEDDFFDVNRYHKNTEEKESTSEMKNTTAAIEEIVYPMYVPSETYLVGQDVIDTEIGERVILTFAGESAFTVIQENIDNKIKDEYVYGEPYLILDTVGSVTDYSVSWISNGIEYLVMSDTMNIDELITVAQSISIEPISK